MSIPFSRRFSSYTNILCGLKGGPILQSDRKEFHHAPEGKEQLWLRFGVGERSENSRPWNPRIYALFEGLLQFQCNDAIYCYLLPLNDVNVALFAGQIVERLGEVHPQRDASATPGFVQVSAL